MKEFYREGAKTREASRRAKSIKIGLEDFRLFTISFLLFAALRASSRLR